MTTNYSFLTDKIAFIASLKLGTVKLGAGLILFSSPLRYLPV